MTAAPSSGTSSGDAGPAVDPGRGAIGQDDVGVPGLGGAEAGGLARPPPDRLPLGAGVVAVRPHQEVQPVGPGLEAGGQLPRRRVESPPATRNRAASAASSITTGVRALHASWSRRTASAGSASAWSSITTRSAAAQATGDAAPGPTITARPSATGPGAGIGSPYAGAATPHALARRLHRNLWSCVAESAIPTTSCGYRPGGDGRAHPSPASGAGDQRRRPVRGAAAAGRGVRGRAGLRVPRPGRARPRAGHHPPVAGGARRRRSPATCGCSRNRPAATGSGG